MLFADSTPDFGQALAVFLIIGGFIVITRKLSKVASENKKEIASGAFGLLKWWLRK